MNIRVNILLNLFCLLPLVSSAQASMSNEGLQFLDNPQWSFVLRQATEQDKLIFVDCYTAWCGPCKALAREVFPRPEVGAYFNPRFINVKYDMEKGDGKKLYERYKKHIIGFPTMLLINKNGEVLQQLAGYQDAEKLLDSIKEVMEGKGLFMLAERYRAGERDFSFIGDYIRALEGAFLKDTLQKVTSEYLANIDLKTLDQDEVWNLLGKYITDINSPAFEHLVKNIDRYYYRLKRDYYTISRQVEHVLTLQVKRLTRITFDAGGKPKELVADPELQKRILNLYEMSNIRRLNEVRAKFTIHDLLVAKKYSEAWSLIRAAAKMQLTGFNSKAVNDYIAYMQVNVDDIKLLKDMLGLLDHYVDTERYNKFFYHNIYLSQSLINQKLGNIKLAEQQKILFEKVDEEQRKEFEAFFKKDV